MSSQTKKTLKSWLSEYQFTHVAHLGFTRDHVTVDQAERELQRWRLLLIRTEGLQIATMGILNHKPTSHLHVLLAGQNRDGRNLNDLTPDEWSQYASYWPGDAQVDEIYSAGIIGYIIDKNTPVGRHELLQPYNKKLLNRIRSRL